jgi:hypothetical protein
MKLFKDLSRANRGVEYLSPHQKVWTVAGDPELRVFVLGPPRHGRKLIDEDPIGDEGFS